MTLDEANITVEYLKEMQEGYIEGEGYERHPLPEWYALDKAIEAIEQTRWIPISERLPEKTGIYLVSIGDLVASKSFDGHNFRTESEVRFIPDAWMPLPEPYKAESEEV